MSAGIRLCLQLMLVTAQRRGEVASATWADIDLSSGWWTIPEATAKNKLPHRVPLSPLAKSLLMKAREEGRDSNFVFPNPSGNGPIRADAISKAVRRNEAKFGIDHFAPHDLRRTAASQMASAGTPRLTIGKILNHVESGVTATYDRHSYDQEKRKALNAWGRKLESMTSGNKAKVVELRTG
jgi:integrase